MSKNIVVFIFMKYLFMIGDLVVGVYVVVVMGVGVGMVFL